MTRKTGCNAPLALTMGEPAGIGGEIALQAWRQHKDFSVPPFFIIDDPKRLAHLCASLAWDIPIRALNDPEETESIFGSALPVLRNDLESLPVPGRPDRANAPAVLRSIERAVQLTKEGRASAVVTNPINKQVLYDAGFRHPGHTEYLAHLAGSTSSAVMMLACEALKVVPVTVHLPLKEAISTLSAEAIVHCGRVTHEALRRDFAIAAPRLALAGLNPHAGEAGSLGREELEILKPAVAKLRGEGIDIGDPAPADSLFHPAARAHYDAAICMYHDQALIPIKTIDFENGVNVTLGLPFVRTSPDHGTAFDIAGSGTANPSSLIAALKMAGQMAASRATDFREDERG
jgi:4-hydroxythreonine-4-phosphate dehydrogenase